MAKLVSTLRFVVKSPTIRGFVGKNWPITYFFILKWVMYVAALCHTFNECAQMYVNVQHDVQQYTITFSDAYALDYNMNSSRCHL